MSGSAERTNVVIVGAGFTGLSAALELKRAGIDFLLLEALDRVGGRVESRPNGLDERIDTGGQFLCDDMPEIMALAKGRGKTLVETYVEGGFVIQPPTSEAAASKAYEGSMAIRDRINAIEPTDAAFAGMSVAGWLETQADTPAAKASFRSMIEGLWCLALEKLPAWYLSSNDRRVTNEVPELQYFLGETMHSLAEDMAADLGDSLRLGMPVMRIEHRPNGVKIVCDGGSIEASAVLVAVPPVMASKIAFEPKLPQKLGHALAVWQSGAVIKLFFRYRQAFWRERGLSGMVMWRDPTGLFAFDMSTDAGHPMLGFFIGGPLALQMRALDDTELRQKAIDLLAGALGPQAAEPIDVLVRNWIDDRWSGGAYSDLIVDMTAMDAEATMLAGAPPVHFACSELSPSYPGYIEGAIVAGRAAAARVAASRP